MKVAEQKVYLSLESSQGRVLNPESWLSEALFVDMFAKRYGWQFARDLIDGEIDPELVAALQGIIAGENKKHKIDALRAKTRGRSVAR